MDSNHLERERGITILSKYTAITWKGTRINIVDTPGHADFGGEVERVLRMVDCVCLLVDAYEGPMPQTRFVTRKALALGLRPILVVNKIDRVGCDPDGTVDATFDLFCALGATDAQLDFPIVYASGREGWAVNKLTDEHTDLGPLLDLMVEKVPPPTGDVDGPFCMQVTTLDYDDYLGYVAIGRIDSGRIKMGDRVLCAHRDGRREEFRVAEAARLPVAQALRAGRGRRRRHLRRHRHGRAERRRDHHRDRAPHHPAAARDRRADGQDAVHVEQRPVRRAGRASTSPRATCASACSRS